MTDRPDPAPKSREWNYHPDLPLADPSVFRRGASARYLAGWFARNWLMLSERVMMVLLAVFCWWAFLPPVSAAEALSMGWIAQIWALNIGLMLFFAGGLHWWFYMRRGQGKALKFDHRDQARANALWNFSNQVHDNMFWSLTSGVAFITAFQALVMWVMANGWSPVISPLADPLWFAAGLVLLPIWSAFHFYWVHRLLHVPFLYRHVHSLHHRNVNVGPWSGLSMHPVEHLLYTSSLLVHLVWPSDPILVLFHVIYLGPGAAMTHTGYEDLLLKDKRRLALGTFYHQLHHRYYECNYGNQEMPWDRWFGTFNDGTDGSVKETRERKKRMHSRG